MRSVPGGLAAVSSCLSWRPACPVATPRRYAPHSGGPQLMVPPRCLKRSPSTTSAPFFLRLPTPPTVPHPIRHLDEGGSRHPGLARPTVPPDPPRYPDTL